MKTTLEKSLEIAENLRGIVYHTNAISEEELQELIQIGQRKEAIDPMLDPTAWRDGAGEANRQTTKVLQALIEFKRIVKAIGDFT